MLTIILKKNIFQNNLTRYYKNILLLIIENKISNLKFILIKIFYNKKKLNLKNYN